MHVTVVGAGAVGMLIAALLKESGCGVTLLARTNGQANELSAEGIIKDGERITVRSVTGWQETGQSDFIMVAVKSGDLENLRSEFARLPPDVPVVFLQNGMSQLEFASSLPQTQMAAGSVEHGVKRTGPASISHRGIGVVKLSLLKGNAEVFRPLLELDAFPAEWQEHAEKMLLRKTWLNCLINPLTALLGLTNGELLSNKYANRLLKELYRELTAAYPEAERALPFRDVESLCRTTGANTSSMLADRLSGKPLELDAIVGYILERSGQDMPVLETLYYLLKATEVD
ncbi:2-dehydropantoate 2-reductase [Indiicoccus explosivorum]|uniref:2-dehydropantoate 2-reductase n=1 Tax=Indiicoccus explosivorum TaxID=1917864 RepID=UPI000B442BB7|nr:2-dehydropantoate 2-reductase [Indiicoccus explosivorum]